MDLNEWIALNIFKAKKVGNGFVVWTDEHDWYEYLPNYVDRIEYAIEVLAALRPGNDNSGVMLYKDLLWMVAIKSNYEQPTFLVDRILATNENPAKAICLATYNLYTGKNAYSG